MTEPGDISSGLGRAFADPAVHRDPYPFYARAREEAPLLELVVPEHPLGRLWLVTRYEDVQAVLGDHRRFSSDARSLYGPGPEGAPEPSMLSQDPPNHTRLRGRVAHDFTPKRVAAMRPSIERMVDERVERLLEGGEFDLIGELALPVPVLVICELLGVPEGEEREQLAFWSKEFIDSSGVGNTGENVKERNEAANMALASYFASLVQRKQAEPDGALISALLQPAEGEEPLSFPELVSMCVLLLVAGHETTVNLIGNGVRTLLRHHSEWERLVADPGLVASAVEECLRFEPPVQRGLFRISLGPVELSGGRLEVDQQVLAAIGSANRDPSVFSDPDVFDVAREPNRHLSFGRGVHFCLGAPLARLEAQLVLRSLVERAPELRVVGRDDDWRPSTLFRGLRQLCVARA